MWTYGINHLLLKSLAAAVQHRGCGCFTLESGLNFAPSKVTEQVINVIHSKKEVTVVTLSVFLAPNAPSTDPFINI